MRMAARFNFKPPAPGLGLSRIPSKQISALPNTALRSLLRNTPVFGILSKKLYRWTQRNKNRETNGVLKLTRTGLTCSRSTSDPGVFLKVKAQTPACGTLAAAIEMTAGAKACFCGRPGPLFLYDARAERTPVQSNTRSAKAAAACKQRSIHWKGMIV